MLPLLCLTVHCLVRVDEGILENDTRIEMFGIGKLSDDVVQHLILDALAQSDDDNGSNAILDASDLVLKIENNSAAPGAFCLFSIYLLTAGVPLSSSLIHSAALQWLDHGAPAFS